MGHDEHLLLLLQLHLSIEKLLLIILHLNLFHLVVLTHRPLELLLLDFIFVGWISLFCISFVEFRYFASSVGVVAVGSDSFVDSHHRHLSLLRFRAVEVAASSVTFVGFSFAAAVVVVVAIDSAASSD